MSNLTAVLSTVASPAETLSHFHQLLTSNDFYYDITWKWAGRSRFGVIKVYDRSDAIVERQAFERNTQRWTERDEVLGRMHFASPKHRALSALVVRISAKY